MAMGLLKWEFMSFLHLGREGHLLTYRVNKADSQEKIQYEYHTISCWNKIAPNDRNRDWFLLRNWAYNSVHIVLKQADYIISCFVLFLLSMAWDELENRRMCRNLYINCNTWNCMNLLPHIFLVPKLHRACWKMNQLNFVPVAQSRVFSTRGEWVWRV
jgi:hypothetical protein